jgi:hypothetical protein
MNPIIYLDIMYCHMRSNYQEDWNPITPVTSITLRHLCACPKPGPGFPIPGMSWSFIIMFSGLQ